MAEGLSERIIPIWLRPVTAGAVVALHAGVLVGVPWPEAEPPAVAAPIAVQVVPMGKSTTAYDAPRQAQVADVTAIEAQASDAQPAQARSVEPAEPIKAIAAAEEAEKTEPPEAVETKAAEAPALVPQAALQAVESDKATLTPAETAEKQVPQPKPKRVAKRKPKRHDRTTWAAAARSRASALARQSDARTVTGSIASANYRSIVAAELNRRKFYPPAARSSGAQGVVVVTFTIGADGRVARHAISRSSGQPLLDGAVRQMMTALSLPPPPGGRFRATVPIRFDIAR